MIDEANEEVFVVSFAAPAPPAAITPPAPRHARAPTTTSQSREAIFGDNFRKYTYSECFLLDNERHQNSDH